MSVLAVDHLHRLTQATPSSLRGLESATVASIEILTAARCFQGLAEFVSFGQKNRNLPSYALGSISSIVMLTDSS
jgi:hypothetical protein